MDLIEKTARLLREQVPFVAVRIYAPSEISGLASLITSQKTFGTLPKNLEKKVMEDAMQVLEQRRSKNSIHHIDNDDIKIFYEFCGEKETLLIVGAGHIAVSLCKIAVLSGFCVDILDDREDWANSLHFPGADKIIVAPFVTGLKEYEITCSTYIVLVTRGHTYDRDCLLQVLYSPAAYIGMIGSLRRLTGVFQLLREQGHSQEKLDTIHAPIGLPIGGRSPQAIAVSILAEIISVQQQGAQWALSLKEHFKEIRS